jgi:hypothetical protein
MDMQLLITFFSLLAFGFQYPYPDPGSESTARIFLKGRFFNSSLQCFGSESALILMGWIQKGKREPQKEKKVQKLKF